MIHSAVLFLAFHLRRLSGGCLPNLADLQSSSLHRSPEKKTFLFQSLHVAGKTQVKAGFHGLRVVRLRVKL
jgi:hypothetical protein